MINNEVVKKLKEKDLTIDNYVYLLSLENFPEWRELTKSDYSLLVRGYVTSEETLTPEGRMLLTLLIAIFYAGNEKSLLEGASNSEFNTWWDLYPDSDEHSHYAMTRGLKSNKERCRILFQQLLKDYKPEQLIEALRKEVETRKLNSITDNQLRWMKNAEKYLEDKAFLPWLKSIEHVKKDNQTFYGKQIS